MANERLTYLFYRYFQKTASREELDELSQLINEPGNEAAVKLLMEEAYLLFEPQGNVLSETQSGQILTNVQSRTRKHINWWRRIAAAAAVLVFISAGLYGWLQMRDWKPAPVIARQNDVPPGTNKAVLHLADGTVVTLDSAGNQVIRQGGTIINQQNGQLHYKANDPNATTVSFNTLATPRGGQYSVTLPDGSKVWLNSASSLRFPTAFTGLERKVELTGEAYFEVAKNAKQPFKVALEDKTTIEVLGTHFNVNAYKDEPAISTTLLEGAVRLTKGKERVTIKPGERAQLQEGGTKFVIDRPDVERVVAWKNGFFQFDGDNITMIMKQLSRWYDIEPVYAGSMSMKDYSGYISRNSNISEVLKMLELTNEIKCKVEGRKVTVSAIK
ncbi:FecR family protein [Chitinophaga niabensis]|uniref:FecR protein n=1 Tax=Chitinophaga niabensis TaxID=536979 RepID=A0A1N6DJQ8_9BACT|nr:FecR family protein [Chitinophaga niabensis]SIN71069.1 FecR protein [Chitinophaga niabensis]